MPPQRVHRMVQYSEPARPGMTRMTDSPASHCGQLDRTGLDSDWAMESTHFQIGRLIPVRLRVEQRNMHAPKQM
jgi:hypothetical protein